VKSARKLRLRDPQGVFDRFGFGYIGQVSDGGWAVGEVNPGDLGQEIEG
jgi:hypothetical protein